MCITYGLIMSVNGYKKEILKRAIPCDSISTLFSARDGPVFSLLLSLQALNPARCILPLRTIFVSITLF